MANNNQKANVVVTMDGKQAEKMLEVLKTKSETLRDELRTLNNQRLTIGLNGDEAKRFDALRKELLETKRVTREVSTQVKDVGDVINKLSSVPIKAIKDSIKTVSSQMERLDRSTQRYADKKKELAILRAELDRINDSGKKTASVFDNIGAIMKRLAAYVLVYAGFNELTQGLKKMYDMNVALSDQLSDIEKTTGLTGQELADLSDEINRIDTRSSVEELNNLAIAAGKLGITGKEDVMGFVKAGNIINVALGEDLGEEAITNIAKLNDVLGITKELGVEKALLSTGSAINELGQSSTANEAYLVDFAQRLGGIAAQSGISMQQILALGSASDQMAQNVEVSATAMNKLITTIVSKTGQVASAIGVTKEELQGVLDRSTWDALLLVFEKLAGKGGLAQIAPLMGDLGSDGARLTAVITALSSNTEKLNREITISNKAFAEAVSVQNEYEKKNNNLAGTIEKIGKNIKYWFLGSGVVEWMLDAASGIERFTRGSDTLDKKFKSTVDTVRNLERNIRPLLDEYERLKDTKTADEQERLKLILSQIASAIPGAVTEMDKYGNVLSISTDRAYAFIEAQKLILKQTNKDLIDDTQKTINRIKIEYGMASKKMKEIYDKGTYTEYTTVGLGRGQTFKTEYEVTDPKKIASVQAEVTKLNAELERQQAILGQLTGDYLDEDLQKIKEIQEKGEKVVVVEPEVSEKDAKKALDAKQKEVDVWLQQQKNALSEAYIEQKAFNGKMLQDETAYNQEVNRLEMEALQKRLSILGIEPAEVETIRGQILDIRRKMMDEAVRIQKDIDKILLEADPVKKEKTDFEERLKTLGLYGLERQLMTADQLRTLELLEEQHQNNLTDIDRRARTQDKKRAEERFLQEYDKKYGVGYETGMQQNDQYVSNQESDMEMGSAIGSLSADEEFTRQMALFEWKMNALREELALRQEVGAETSDVFEKMAKVEKQSIGATIAYTTKKFDSFRQVGETLGESFGTVFENVGEGFKNLGSTMADMALDYLAQMAQTWLTELAISATINTAAGAAKEIGSKGLLGIATAAAIGAAIAGLVAVAKAGVKSLLGGGSKKKSSAAPTTGQRVVKQSGYAEGGHVTDLGGYTGNGSKYEVAGLVHKGEYVVPKWMMQSPVVMDNVRILETIRQTKRTHIPILPAGYAEGGGVDTAVSIAPPADPELKNAIKQMNLFLQQLGNKEFTTTLNVSRLNDFQNRLSASVARGSRPK